MRIVCVLDFFEDFDVIIVVVEMYQFVYINLYYLGICVFVEVDLLVVFCDSVLDMVVIYLGQSKWFW